MRVFVGDRIVAEEALLPPWRECLVVAVPRDGNAPYLVEDDGRFRPVLR